jgi:hypothetical protein
MVLASSLTGLAEGLLNGLRDPAGQNKGGGMDIARWTDFQIQITEMRNRFQAGDWHTIWEAHILKTITKNQSGGDESSESIQVSGKSGVNFPYNVEQFFRIRWRHQVRLHVSRSKANLHIHHQWERFQRGAEV